MKTPPRPTVRVAVYAISLAILTVPLLILLGCGGGPEAALPQMPWQRVVRESDGLLHDRALAGMVCRYAMTTDTCEQRCYPIEPLFRACGTDDGLEYWYTAQGFLRQLTYGAIPTRVDTACGDTTYQLVKLVPQQRPERAHDCTDPRFDISPSLHDRNWYRTKAPPFPAAPPE